MYTPRSMNDNSPSGQICESRKVEDKGVASNATNTTKESSRNLEKEAAAAKKTTTLDKKACKVYSVDNCILWVLTEIRPLFPGKLFLVLYHELPFISLYIP